LNDAITVPKPNNYDYQNYKNNITLYNDQDLNVSANINTQSVSGPSQIDLPTNNLTANNDKETDTLVINTICKIKILTIILFILFIKEMLLMVYNNISYYYILLAK